MTLLCVLGGQGCDFIGDVSLGNNDGKGGSVATGGSESATGGSASPNGGSGSGGSDNGGGEDSSGGSAPSGGTSTSTGGASTGGSGPSSGGAGTAGTGEAGVMSGGSSAGGAGPGGAPQAGAGGSAAGAGGSGGSGAVGGASSYAGAGGASGSGYGGAGGTGPGGYLGCTFIGGVDRIVVSKRDVANNRCLSLVLWDGPAMSADIDLPERWSVETVAIGPAEECPSRYGTRVQASVSGSLTFVDFNTGGGPIHVAVDATIDFAAGQPATGTERLNIDSVDVRAQCNAACIGVGPNHNCNDNIAVSSIHGRCTAANTCVCDEGYELNPATGKCL